VFGTRAKLATAVAVVGAVGATGAAIAGNGGRNFNANLTGYEEVPSISTAGNGRFTAQVDRGGTQIRYTLTYRDLEGGATSAAHIHFAQRGVNGDVSAFLCGGGTKPPCPPSGSVSGVIVASDVIGPANKGIAPGEIDELIRAMRAGATYVNVHTTPTYPTGEIRGQIGRGGGGDGGGRGRNGGGDDDSDD
jgi:hypothetical protein